MNCFRWIPAMAALVAGAGALAQVAPTLEPDLFSDDPPPPEARRAQVMQQANRSGPATALQDYRHTRLFSNGRQLHGELAKVTRDEIIWQRKDASEPIRFARGEVRRILLAPDNAAHNGSAFGMPQATLPKM